jgi:hypothetical protein
MARSDAKTISEWLKVLPDDVRKAALRNIQNQHGKNAGNKLGQRVISLEQAIDRSMHWAATPEGHDYWQQLSEKRVPLGPAKPVKVWMKELSLRDQYRLVYNIREQYPDEDDADVRLAFEVHALSQAVGVMVWRKTPEGDHYWNDIAEEGAPQRKPEVDILEDVSDSEVELLMQEFT